MLHNPLESIFRPNNHTGFSVRKDSRLIRPHLKERVVFLVEENLFVRHSMKDFLEDLGLRIRAFSSGWDAVKYIDRHGVRPDVILFDLGHSIVQSWPALKQLREELGEIPMIISSGLDDSLFKHEIDALGGCQYIQKPYTYERLAKYISQCVNNKCS